MTNKTQSTDGTYANKPGCTGAYTLAEVIAIIEGLRRQNWSLRQIAKVYYGDDMSHGTIQRVLKGIEPKDPKARWLLGLPALAPAPVCRRCGNVHVTKTCTANRKPPTRWADYPLHLLRAAIENRKEM